MALEPLSGTDTFAPVLLCSVWGVIIESFTPTSTQFMEKTLRHGRVCTKWLLTHTHTDHSPSTVRPIYPATYLETHFKDIYLRRRLIIILLITWNLHFIDLILFFIYFVISSLNCAESRSSRPSVWSCVELGVHYQNAVRLEIIQNKKQMIRCHLRNWDCLKKKCIFFYQNESLMSRLNKAITPKINIKQYPEHHCALNRPSAYLLSV